MDIELKEYRIFRYMLVLGLAIVFLAILMIFSGTNVQADVIVDQSGGGDYLTIQEGIDNAVPGENVFVWDGSYNENITIDKPLQLIGNGPATTIIDGFGTMNNIINITAEGVEITGFNITESGAWYGIWTNVGGFNIHDNVFVTQNYAIYVDIYHLNTGSVSVGDMNIQNNDFNGTHGIYFDEVTFENPQTGMDITVGNTIITDNFINITTGDAIAVEDCVVVNMTGGSINWGNIEIMDNAIETLGSNAIYFNGYLENLTDVDVFLGNFDISSNTVFAQADDGIYLDYWGLWQLYGTTTISCGSTTIYDNDIVTNNQGISVTFDNIGQDMYDFSSISIGDVAIDQNTIDTTGGTHGIHFELLSSAYDIYNDSMVIFGDLFITDNNIKSNFWCIHFVWDHVGYNMNDNAYVSIGETHVDWNVLNRTGGAGMAIDTYPVNVGNQMYDASFLTYGNWYVDNNDIVSSGGGIYTGHEYVGYEMYGNSQVIFSDYFVRDNSIEADSGRGLYIGYYDCGESMWDYTRVTGGTFLVRGNTVSSTNQYGYYLYYDYMGYDMYDDTYASFGWVETSNNNFSSVNSYGAYIDIYYLGAYMYGNSQAYIDDITIINNEFWSTTNNGLYYYEFYENAYDMYDHSYVRIGDILVNDNYINSGGDGIYLDTWTENAYDMYQNANADLGNFEFNRNIIEAGGAGIYMNQVEYWAYNIYWDNQVTMGHWQINDNMINATTGVGIDMNSWYDIGAYMYGTSTFTMGNFEVQRNVVNAYGDDGIDVFFEDLAYYIYGSSHCYYGNFLINDNIVNSTRNGIDLSYIEYLAYNMYDNSYAEFGNFEVNNNDIIAGYGSLGGYDGIYMYFYENGYEMYGNSRAYFGHLQINDNTIRCEDDDGIHFYYFYEIGAYLYDNSYFEIGNVEVCRNWIDANDDGMFIEYMYELGYYNYDNSQVHFGDFLFNENNITSSSDGIYAEYYEYWGYELDDSADAYFGDVEFNNNTINASGYGIEIEYFYYWGYDLYGDNEVILGHVQVNDNNVLATNGDGIYVYYFYDIGSYMEQTSYFYMENFEICRNTINASGDGLEMYEIDELAYYNYDNSIVIFGDFLFNDNSIISGAYGFYNEYIEYLAYEMYDQAYAEFGNFEFNNNTIDAVDYGMYWNYGFYENAYQMEDSSRCIMGHYQINDNIIYVSAGDGIYFYEWYEVGYYMREDAYFEMGNLEVCRNTINATGYGIYWYYFEYVAYYMGYSAGIEYPGFTTFIMGDILFNDNMIISGNTGIYVNYIYELAYEMYGNAKAVFGNIEFCRNVVNATSYGFYLDYFDYWGAYMYDSSTATFGDFLFNNNDIVSTDDGLYIDYFEYIGYEMYDRASFQLGDFEYNNNIVDAGSEGLYTYMEYWAYNMYDQTAFTMGHHQMNDNVIKSVDIGIDMDYFYEIAIYMEGSSSFYMENFEILRNEINTSANDGIQIDIEYLGYDLEDNAWCHFGDFLFNDNNIVASQYGINVNYIEYLGAYLSDTNPSGSCYAEFGNVEFNRNTITSLDDGIYVSDWEYWGYELYGSSQVHFGHIQINDNTITAGNATTSSEGMYFSDGPAYGFASYMYDSSYVTFGNLEICRNIINATDYGMELYYYDYIGYEMYDSSRAEFQNFLVSENEVIAGGYGIYINYFYNVASYMYDESFFTMGNFQVNDNIITAGLASSNSGIEFNDWAYNGYDMNQNAYAEFGSFEVCRNLVNTTGDGIYIYAYYWGYNMYDQSVFTMGDWLVNDNTIINTGSEALYLEAYEWGYDNYDSSRVHFGNLEVMRNNINTTNADGMVIWWWYEWAYYLYDYAYLEAGDCIIRDNVIESWSSSSFGMYFGPDSTGNYVYDEAQAYFGDYYVVNNYVFSNGTEGMDIYYDEIAAYLQPFNFFESRSIFVMGGIWITDNTIIAPNGRGIYLEGLWGAANEIYEYSSATIGGLYIEGNTITARDDGIHLPLHEFGYGVYDQSHVMLGPVEINNNDITVTDGTGIYIYIYNMLYDIDSDAEITIADISINDNIITANTTGIDILYEDCQNLFSDCIAYFPGLLVTGNTVNSAITAFNYATTGTPWNVDPTVTLYIGDVIIEDNTFDGGSFGMFFEWQNPDPSVPQPAIYINYCDIEDGSLNSIGLLMRNITNAYIETLSIDSYDQGIYVNNSNIWLMFNSTITNTASYDLNLSSDSYIGAVNCTFDQADVLFEDYDSLLDVGWFMNVLVITPAGYGVPEANVTVEDVYSTPAFDRITNSIGRAFYIVCWEYTENITGIIDTYNDYTADADKSGVFGSAIPDPTMDQSKLVIIILGDTLPPTIIGDLSDTAGTTGDPFNFGVDSTDNFGIYRAYVNYRLGTTGIFTNVTMTGMGPHWKTVIMSSGDTGPMEYYFAVQDVGGYWVQTGTKTVQITDNDAPTIVSDNSNTTATTGDAFSFDLDAIDNVAISEAHVVWWFGTGAPNNDTMAGSGPYNFTINAPSGSLDTLHYYFTIVDAEGNWFVGPQVDIAVTDNDAPIINVDDSDTFADLGQTFNFNVDITDNIGMNETHLVYWFGTEPPTEVVMTGVGPYTYQITIPSDLIYKLHYYFKANDIFDNWLMGPQVDVNITDSIPPSDINDTSDTIATTGDSFMFKVNATDNIGLAEATVTYWFGTGTQTTTTMTGTGPFTLSITVPSGSLDTMHYYFTINDFDANSLIGPQVDIIVQDNDAPTIISDDSDDAAATGNVFTFDADFTDNIDVDNAYVVYWFGTEPETTATMIGTGPFTKVIIIPDYSVASLHYYLKAMDSAGNTYTGSQQDITVTDDDSPILISDGTGTTAITGQSFAFNATFIDNIGILEVKVYYWLGTGTPTGYTMIGTNIFTHTINIPNSMETLYYYFEAKDSASNEFGTIARSVRIVDNTPGTLSNDQSDTSGKEGIEFGFQIDASDNVGISEVMAAYWFGDDETRKVYLPLTGADGTYSGSFTPQEDGMLHYYFMVADEGGNTFESDENAVSIGAKPEEDEADGVLLPWILVVLLIIVILLLLFLMMRKKKEEEGPSEVLGLGEPEEEITEGPGEGEIQEEVGGEEGPEAIEEPPEEEVIEEEVIDEELRPEEEIVDEEPIEEDLPESEEGTPTELDEEPKGELE